MAIRNEWTEWHLTPDGWKRGSVRVQGKGNTWADEPEDRVLSTMYKEVETSSTPEPLVTFEETWRSKTATDIDALLRQFGPGPRQL
jgi:hypothetical protein